MSTQQSGTSHIKRIATIIATLIGFALLVWCINTFTIVKQDKLDFYKKLEHSMSSTKSDTVVVRDTIIEPAKPSKPTIIWKDSIVEVPVLDSMELVNALQQFYAKHVFEDTLKFEHASVALIDTVSQNMIVARQASLQVFKSDTVIKTVTNNIVEQVGNNPRNFVDVQLGIVQNDMQLYEVSYMRQFGAKKLQWRLGAGVGNIWTDAQNNWFTSIKFGVAF